MFGKLSVFSQNRGQGWRLVVGLAPIVLALMVALSRTSDYHHHWQGKAWVDPHFHLHLFFSVTQLSNKILLKALLLQLYQISICSLLSMFYQ